MRQFILAVLVAVALCGRAEAAGSPSVASSASCNTNAGSSVTCTVSRAPSLALGDKLVAFGIGQYNKAITPPSGFSTLRSTTTDFGEALFYKDAVTNSDPTSYTFSLPSSGNLSVALFLVTNSLPGAPQFAYADVGSVKSITTAALTPTTLGLPLAFFGGAQTPDTFSTSSGYTIGPAQITNDYDVMAEYAAVLGSLTSYTVNSTVGTNFNDAHGYAVLVAPPTPPPAAGEFSRYFTGPLVTPLASIAYSYVANPMTATIWNTEVTGQNGTGRANPSGTWYNSTGPWGPSRAPETQIPVYVSAASDTLLAVNCPGYDYSCNSGTQPAQGKSIRVNLTNDVIQNQSDHHIMIIDPTDNAEVDCWQAQDASGSHDGSGETNAQLHVDGSSGTLKCGNAGYYTLGSTGLRGSYSNETTGAEGIHFGPATGAFMVGGQELLNGFVPHAIALNMNCLNNIAPGLNVYPADNGQSTDDVCSLLTANGQAPIYGQGIQYLGNPVVASNAVDAQIAASSRSNTCKAILTAEHDYGAYFSDTGAQGTVIDTESEVPYQVDASAMGADPWPAIVADLKAAGDADSSGNWQDCFNGLTAANFAVFQLTHP